MRAGKTSARRRTHRSPILAHETSLVSGASVVGMTYGAHHGPGSMPAGVPGIPAASAREDRLRRRAGCASSRLTTPKRTGAGRWRQNSPTAVSPKAEDSPDKTVRGAEQD
jgi:hypothetical protein